MSLVSQKKAGFTMFCLFEFVSNLFQPVVARYGDEFTKKFDLEIYNKSTSG